MPRIDIGAVLADKAPRLARWIPGFVIGWLRRTIHESEINYILEHYWNLPPQEFIRACFREWQVTYTVEGLEKLDPKGRYLFAANHPFGGMDGMMLADKLIDRFGDARVVVNDLLMHLEPLRPLWIPVNKHGSQNSAYARKFDEEFVGEVPILTFPAGLCSRCIGGEVTDLPWKTNFLKKAYASQREIVPVFVEGRLSNFFYRVARLRVMLGLKLNIEMLWLPDEMFPKRAGTSAFSWATRFPSPSCSVTADSASRPNSYAKRRIFWKICSRRNRKNAKIGIFAPVICNRDRWKPSYLPLKGNSSAPN